MKGMDLKFLYVLINFYRFFKYRIQPVSLYSFYLQLP